MYRDAIHFILFSYFDLKGLDGVVYQVDHGDPKWNMSVVIVYIFMPALSGPEYTQLHKSTQHAFRQTAEQNKNNSSTQYCINL